MTNPSYAEFSAGDSMLGYIYQCEYALYHLLDRDHLTTQVSIETLDDIVAGDLTNPQALLQLKLHAVNGDGSIRSLTDRNPDLWKTLRVWATHIRDERLDPARTTFMLLTTSPLGTQPGLGHLLGPVTGPGTRNVPQARIDLERLASEILAEPGLGASGLLVKGASAFSALKPSQRLDLVRNIVIVTGTPSITALRKQIENRLRAAGSTKESHPQFVETIVGWWYRQCIEQINDKDGRTIPFEALERKMAETAMSLSVFGLPRCEILESPTEADLAGLKERLFVHQLILLGLGIGNVLIRNTILDFYKTDGHRKKWIEECRLDRKELDTFEADLRGVWALHFGLAEAEVEDCEACADPDTALRKLGRRVLRDTLGAKTPTLKGFEGEYLGRGSYHIMANGPNPTIGWHPCWKALLPSDGDIP